ncbi:DNA cytosine methyltransferase [Fodinicola acaciae]|uniref:DNA cytosine methyltransferase n=1 Tax=Fodinicola acaciae TaxID=2681555 RepID=UPI0013D18B60|nr:DNA (cytosine-5-)-methyltransferase [Fodinicola acaciae]
MAALVAAWFRRWPLSAPRRRRERRRGVTHRPGATTGHDRRTESAIPRPAGGPRIGSLCTGAGGLDIGVQAVLGGQLVWYADPDRYATALLARRFPDVANLGDITTVDWPHVPPVDVLTAGFPCQDTSNAGYRTGVTEGTRSGLWTSVAEAIRHLRPRRVVLENVAALRSRGLDRLQADLAALGYDTAWTCLRASAVGAAHHRDRLFLLATRTTPPYSAAESR